MNLGDINPNPHLASDDFAVGTTFPALTVQKVKKEMVSAPGSSKKSEKVIIYFQGAKKSWAANHNELRRIAKALNEYDPEKWVGKVKISLKVVDGVRRPTGGTGHAFRVAEILPVTNETTTDNKEN